MMKKFLIPVGVLLLFGIALQVSAATTFSDTA